MGKISDGVRYALFLSSHMANPCPVPGTDSTLISVYARIARDHLEKEDLSKPANDILRFALNVYDKLSKKHNFL